jgi:protein phosphatase
VRAGAASHVGYFRENNEDRVYLDPDYPFALVLDGMGGLAAGEIASRNGEEAIARALRTGLRAGAEPPGLIEEALCAGNTAVRTLGEFDRTLRNCGTTVVLALWHRTRVYVSWLGDSPAFLISRKHVKKLTWDHDLRTALVRHGISAAGAQDYRIDSVLLRYLGAEESKEPIEVPSFTPRCGDRLVLATDGVTGVTPEPVLLEICRAHPDPHVCAEALVAGALERGSRDNCTCAVIAFGDAAPRRPRKWWRLWR